MVIMSDRTLVKYSGAHDAIEYTQHESRHMEQHMEQNPEENTPLLEQPEENLYPCNTCIKIVGYTLLTLIVLGGAALGLKVIIEGIRDFAEQAKNMTTTTVNPLVM